MPFLLLLSYFIVSVVITAGLNHMALVPWRRTAGKHWTERARVLYPARVGVASTNLWLPVILMLVQFIYLSEWEVSLLFVVVVTAIGSAVGTWPFVRESMPWIELRRWRNCLVVGLGTKLVGWLIFVMVLLSMPDGFSWTSVGLTMIMVIYDLWGAFGGNLVWMKKLGVVRPVSDRVRKIIEAESRTTGIRSPKFWVYANCECNAYALVWQNCILFTDKLLEVMTDAELRAITAHELGHLSESRRVKVLRGAGFLAKWMLLFVKPIIHSGGPAGILLLFIGYFLIRRLATRLTRRMEHRADAEATSGDGRDAAEYARALEKLHECNLAPARMPRQNSSHPDLYDRMIAVGVTPDFAEPGRPARSNVIGYLLQVSAWMLLILHHRMIFDSLETLF